MSNRIAPALAARLITQLPALRRYAVALCGEAALADDLVQDGIERALRAAATLRAPDNLAAWLRSIVRHLYFDELRRRKVRGVPVDVADMANDLSLSSRPEADGSIADVQRALHGLSLDHRQILVLAAVEELSYREIAEELGLPLGTVMSRLARARAALRAALAAAPALPAGAPEPPP